MSNTSRRIASSFRKGRLYSIACMGDSLTNAVASGVRYDQYWPEVLAARLRAAGASVTARNLGKSGDTSTQMLARVHDLVYFDPAPKIAVLWAGYNDPGASIPQATTQSNIQAMIRYLRNGCAGQVAGQASLPADAVEGTKYLVVSDTSSTGGLLPDLSGEQTGPQVWEARNALAGESGWGRIDASAGTSITRFLLLTTHFCNYGSGGDTVDAEGGHAGQNATRKQVYDAQAAAAAAEGDVVVCDVYEYFQARIVAGTDTATNHTWHIADGDIHLNAYGEDLVAQAAYDTIIAQEGWLAAIT